MTELDEMTCREAFSLLNDFIDQELDDEEMARVQAHLDVCRICASEFQFEASLYSELKQTVRSLRMPSTAREQLFRALDAAIKDGSS